MAINKTAWGNTHIFFAKAQADQSMPALSALKKMGYILEGTLSITNEEGDALELFEEGHILRDQVRLEGTITIECEIIGIPDEIITEFLQVEAIGEGEAAKRRVKSLINNDKHAIAFYVPDAPGSDTIEAPTCTVNMGVAYSSTQGWTLPLEIILIKGTKEYLFDWGIVPATPPVPEG